MPSRVLWRRSATALGTYGAAVLGFAATIVSARILGPDDFALLTLATLTAGFFQVFLDLTVDEALVKFGFRYAHAESWGRLRRLFRVGILVKLAGALAAGVPLLALAPFAGRIWTGGLFWPMVIASLIPITYAGEGIAGPALIVRGRYEIRALFLAVSMGLRLVGLTIGSLYGVAQAVAGLVLAQTLSTASLCLVGWLVFRGTPAAPQTPLADDVGALRRFVVQSTIGTALSSMRALLGAPLLGIVAAAPQVSYFRTAQAPITAFAAFSSPARLILLAEQTRDFEQGRLDRVFRLLRRYILGTGALVALTVPVLWWRMPDLIRLGPGSDYLAATDAARLILLVAALQLVWGWTKSFPVSIGRPGLRNVVAGIEIAVFVPLLLLMGSAWGATGGAGAMLISTAVFAAVWGVILVRMRRDLRVAARGPQPTPNVVVP